MIELSVLDLATVGGCAAVTAILLQLAIKPLIENLNIGKWQPLAVNVSAVLVSVGFALAAVFTGQVSYELGLQAVLTGLGGAVVATSGYEVVKNTWRAVVS